MKHKRLKKTTGSKLPHAAYRETRRQAARRREQRQGAQHCENISLIIQKLRRGEATASTEVKELLKG